jgi:ergothioneine biosynthesis protein EgtB
MSDLLESPQQVESSTLAERFASVRGFSEKLCETLEPEDCAIQSMPDVSPTRWHLAHTTWFFETFVLSRVPGHQPLDDRYAYLFNSYYNAVGEPFPRARRGLLSRPTLREVWEYRQAVDEQMLRLLERAAFDSEGPLAAVVELGLHHEQQHQELMLTDIKHVLSCNPLLPVYREGEFVPSAEPSEVGWKALDAGVYWIGHEGEGFAFDNERPRHRVFLEAFEIAGRLVTCGEYLDFMHDRR